MSPTYYLVRPGEPSCMECGEASGIRGDPRRGFCLTHKHMVGSMGACHDFTRTPWQDRLPHNIVSTPTEEN